MKRLLAWHQGPLSFPLGRLSGFASDFLSPLGLGGSGLGEADAGLITISEFDAGQFERVPQDSKRRKTCFRSFALK
jgi:hypothetical protein